MSRNYFKNLKGVLKCSSKVNGGYNYKTYGMKKTLLRIENNLPESIVYEDKICEFIN